MEYTLNYTREQLDKEYTRLLFALANRDEPTTHQMEAVMSDAMARLRSLERKTV